MNPSFAQTARRLWSISKKLTCCIFATLLLVGCRPLLLEPPLPMSGDEAPSAIGQLAYIGEDGNVYVASTSSMGEQTTRQQITDDATTFLEGIGRSYHRLSWSPSGHLAFAAVDRTSTGQEGQLYVAAPHGASPKILASAGAASDAVLFNAPIEIARSATNPFIYTYWSPQPCGTIVQESAVKNAPQCQRLAYLITEGEDVALHVVDIITEQGEGERIQNRTLDLGRPFYISWASDGTKLLGHIGGARRYLPEAKIVLYDLELDERTESADAPGPFLAPAWSPQEQRWLSVVDGDPTQLDSQLLLQIGTEDGQRPIADVETGTEFVWSPDGKKVAFATRNPRGPYFRPIHIFDVETGKITELTERSLKVRAFFWSPDGKRIGYLHWLSSTVSSLMQWRTIDVASGQDRGFPAFNAAYGMNFMIGSFNQYAQSHRFWSPDSRFLVYVEMDLARMERVWLIDTFADRDAEPILVGKGSLAVWSWE